MKKRNPFAVYVLSIITFGIYDLYWLVKTKAELNSKTRQHTPSIWLLVSPLLLFFIAVIVFVATSKATSPTVTYFGSASPSVNGPSLIGILLFGIASVASAAIPFYWVFKFSKAVNEYTNGKSGTGVTFLLLWTINLIGVAIVQDTFNDMIDSNPTPELANNMNPIGGPAYPTPVVNPMSAPTTQNNTPDTSTESNNDFSLPNNQNQ